MSCGNPPAISNGKLNFTGTSYNSTAHYKCDDGFSLNTVAVKRCTAKKRWSGLTPRCRKSLPHVTGTFFSREKIRLKHPLKAEVNNHRDTVTVKSVAQYLVVAVTRNKSGNVSSTLAVSSLEVR